MPIKKKKIEEGTFGTSQLFSININFNKYMIELRLKIKKKRKKCAIKQNKTNNENLKISFLIINKKNEISENNGQRFTKAKLLSKCTFIVILIAIK